MLNTGKEDSYQLKCCCDESHPGANCMFLLWAAEQLLFPFAAQTEMAAKVAFTIFAVLNVVTGNAVCFCIFGSLLCVCVDSYKSGSRTFFFKDYTEGCFVFLC